MRKIVLLIITFFLGIVPVYAKDTVYSINRYSDEVFYSILKSNDDKNNGYIMGGTFSKKEKVEDGDDFYHTQVMAVKYKKNGEIDWSYHYGKTGEDEFYQMSYSYDEEHQINGYVLLVRESYEIGEDVSDQISYVFLDLDGNLVKEENSGIYGEVNSIEELYEDDNISGYLISGLDTDNHAFMAKLDLQFHTIWIHKYQEYSEFREVIFLNQFFFVLAINEEKYQLLKYNSEGELLAVVRDSFEDIDMPHIVSDGEYFVLYGYTNEVKLGSNDSSSYYLDQYDGEGNLVWDTVGNVAINTNELLQLQPIIEDSKCLEYHLLYISSSDGSCEIVRVGIDGVIHNKIKKIKNNYYHINSFLSDDNILYFIGQINCPDDDNCDYDTNSLFLVSNEDKIIEVKDNDSRNIMLGFAAFVCILFLGTTFFHKKRRLN